MHAGQSSKRFSEAALAAMREVIPGKNLDGQGWHEVRSAERASRNNDDIIPCRPIELATFRGHLLRRRDRREHDEGAEGGERSEEHTSELQSLMRISYAVFCLQKTITTKKTTNIVSRVKQSKIMN